MSALDDWPERYVVCHPQDFTKAVSIAKREGLPLRTSTAVRPGFCYRIDATHMFPNPAALRDA